MTPPRNRSRHAASESASPDDALQQAHDRLSAAVEQLVSGADWQAMLQMAARFHDYSHRNILLLMIQCAERGIDAPTRFAGYRAWQGLGRQVRRGEHALDVLAPVLRRTRDEEPDRDTDRDRAGRDGTGRDDTGRDGTGRVASLANSDGEPARRRDVLAGFKIAKVFELSQTEGEPLHDVVPQLLGGDAPAALYAGLAREVEASGFALLREDCSPANGRTDFAKRTVTVRPDCSPAQAAKTLAHELGHVRLHNDPRFIGFGGSACRGLAEVEAESVAFLVCSTAGLSTDGYTFPYVARWANGDVELVRSTGERSLGAAREISRSLGLIAPARDAASERIVAASRAARAEREQRGDRTLAPSRPAPERSVPVRPAPAREVAR